MKRDLKTHLASDVTQYIANKNSMLERVVIHALGDGVGTFFRIGIFQTAVTLEMSFGLGAEVIDPFDEKIGSGSHAH